MARIIFILAGAAALLFAANSSGWALTGDAPWCAVVNMGFGELEWDCHYQTVEQCSPNVLAGNRGFCSLNPYYAPPVPRSPGSAPKRHRHHVN